MNSSNENEISHGRVPSHTSQMEPAGKRCNIDGRTEGRKPRERLSQTCFAMWPLDAMKGCKAWAKRAHALYEKQHNNPS